MWRPRSALYSTSPLCTPQTHATLPPHPRRRQPPGHTPTPPDPPASATHAFTSPRDRGRTFNAAFVQLPRVGKRCVGLLGMPSWGRSMSLSRRVHPACSKRPLLFPPAPPLGVWFLGVAGMWWLQPRETAHGYFLGDSRPKIWNLSNLEPVNQSLVRAPTVPPKEEKRQSSRHTSYRAIILSSILPPARRNR